MEIKYLLSQEEIDAIKLSTKAFKEPRIKSDICVACKKALKILFPTKDNEHK